MDGTLGKSVNGQKRKTSKPKQTRQMKRKSIEDYFKPQTKTHKHPAENSLTCPTCMVAFGNPGALATHVKIKHSKLDPEGTGSMLQFVKPKPNVPFWKILAVVGGCWIAKHFLPGKMDPSRMTFVRKWPDNKEQETEKVDGRKNNRGMDGRRSYSNEFKAKVLDEYFGENACNPSIKQETCCIQKKT